MVKKYEKNISVSVPFDVIMKLTLLVIYFTMIISLTVKFINWVF